jgi:hypothetical protein
MSEPVYWAIGASSPPGLVFVPPTFRLVGYGRSDELDHDRIPELVGGHYRADGIASESVIGPHEAVLVQQELRVPFGEGAHRPASYRKCGARRARSDERPSTTSGPVNP